VKFPHFRQRFSGQVKRNIDTSLRLRLNEEGMSIRFAAATP